MYCDNYCNCPFLVENSGDGPFVFTVQCQACTPDLRGHLNDCTGIVAHGILHKGGGVDIITATSVTRYPDCAEAYNSFDYELRVAFTWGPTNPEAALEFC